MNYFEFDKLVFCDSNHNLHWYLKSLERVNKYLILTFASNDKVYRDIYKLERGSLKYLTHINSNGNVTVTRTLEPEDIEFLKEQYHMVDFKYMR